MKNLGDVVGGMNTAYVKGFAFVERRGQYRMDFRIL